MDHLHQNLGGMENMTTLPDAMFVIDSNAEEIAVREARRMGVPVVSIVDTNCNPEVVDWIIPGNDDALRAIRLFTSKISDAVIEGKQSLEQSQLAEAKQTEGAEVGADGIDPSVEYKDTSKYESYEKSEGDFVDPATLEQPFAADAALDPVAEVPDKDAAAKS
jgi:small subunit ribosomal protein S2